MSSLSQAEILKQRILARKQATVSTTQETSPLTPPVAELPMEKTPVPVDSHNGHKDHSHANESPKPAEPQNDEVVNSTSSQQPIQHLKDTAHQSESAEVDEDEAKEDTRQAEEIESEIQNSEAPAEEVIEEEIKDIEEEEVEPAMIDEESEDQSGKMNSLEIGNENAFLPSEEENTDNHPEKSTSQLFEQEDIRDASDQPSLKEHIQYIDQEVAHEHQKQFKEQSDRKFSEAQSKLELTDLQQDYLFEDEPEQAEDKSKEEQVEEIQLGKKPQNSLMTIKEPERKLFKIKTRTYYHDCSKLGLKCPDFNLLQKLFESISTLRLLDAKEPTIPSKDLGAQIGELKQIIDQLVTSEPLRDLYTSELIYIVKSILGFNNNKANQGFLSLISSMLQAQSSTPEAVDELVHILTISSFFDTTQNPLQSLLDLEKPLFTKALVVSYTKEHVDIKVQAKFELIKRLSSHYGNLAQILAYLDTLPRNELVSEKLITLFESITDVNINSYLDYNFLKRLVKISLTPNARLRYKGLQLIRNYLQEKDLDSVVNHDDFKSLAICLFVNKVYHTSNKALNPEEFIKALWAFVGKSQIRDMLFDYPEDFLLEYARLLQESTAFLKITGDHLSQVEIEDVYDFQVSLLIAVTEIHRTSLSEDTLSQSIPIILGFINELFDTSNPRIEQNRLVKFLNYILEDFRKPDVPDVALECFNLLPMVIQARINLLLQAECIAQFEVTVNLLHKPTFSSIKQQIDFYGLLHNLSETEQDLLTLLIYENISEEDAMNEQIESRVLEIAESLIDPSIINSPLFISIKRLTNNDKFKRLAAHVIKANFDEVVINLDANADKVSELANWCKEPLLNVLDEMASEEGAEHKEESIKKIRTLLTNFNQC